MQLLCILCGLLIIILLLIFLNLQKLIFTEKHRSERVNGICYFDIDGTLTHANDNADDIIQVCLDNNFAVGIITASGRTVNHVCNKNKSTVNWMSDKLCNQFYNNNAKMYNSTTMIDGSYIFPKNYPINASPGYVKGFLMDYGRNNNYPYLPDDKVVLFDDDINFIRGVKQYNNKFKTQYVKQHTGYSSSSSNLLCKDFVQKTIDKMLHT